MIAFGFGLVIGLILGCVITIVVNMNSKKLEKAVNKVQEVIKPKAKAIIMYPDSEAKADIKQIVAENDRRGLSTNLKDIEIND